MRYYSAAREIREGYARAKRRRDPWLTDTDGTPLQRALLRLMFARALVTDQSAVDALRSTIQRVSDRILAEH